jgi:hypothetical protein
MTGRWGVVAVGFAVVMSGCGGGAEPASTHNVKIDAGGSVRYAFADQEPLSGVIVTLTDVDGEVYTVTTNSAGLWTLENLQPGVYVEEYALAGYLAQTGTFAIPAGGENNVKNVFLTRPDVFLEEMPATAAVSPFDVTVIDGAEPRDGLAGVAMSYSSSGNAAIVITLSERAAFGFVRLTDDETGQDIFATPDATDTVFTFSEAAISQINGGGPDGALTFDQDPFSWHEIDINLTYYTPIHGDLVDLDATLFFNSVP